MTKPKIRITDVIDAGDIYDLCTKVELSADNVATDEARERLCNDGFLMMQYSKHPEMVEIFKECVANDDFYVCVQYYGDVIGFLLGYDGEHIKNKRPELITPNRKIKWNEDVQDLTDFVLLDKIVVDPAFRRQGIATAIFRHYVENLKQGIRYVMTETFEQVFRDETPLNITNKASISFFEKNGFKKVGESEVYSDPDSFLGNEGRFKDGIYLATVDEILKFTGQPQSF